MNAYMNKNNGKRLIAAIAVFAMIACCLAVAVPSADAATDSGNYVDIRDAPEGAEEVSTFEDLKTALKDDKITNIVIIPAAADETVDTQADATKSLNISENLEIPAGKNVFIGKTYDKNGSGESGAVTPAFQVTLAAGKTLTVAGNLYVNLGNNSGNCGLDLTTGTMTLEGTGAVYLPCAISKDDGYTVNGFLTNSNGTKGEAYQHIYAADLNTILPYVNGAEYSNYPDSEKTPVRCVYSYGTTAVAGNVNLSNVTLNIGGISGSSSVMTVEEGATLTIGATASVVKSPAKAQTETNTLGADEYRIVNKSVINVYGTLGGDKSDGLDIENHEEIRILSEDAKYDVSQISGPGSVNTSAISSEATLSGELQTNNTVFTANQIVTITDDLTLVAGASLIIQGTMIIPEGVTVTVEDGAQLIIDASTASIENNGNIVIQSAKVGTFGTDGTFTEGKNYSSQNTDYKYGFAVINGASIENNGSISIEYVLASDADESSIPTVFLLGTDSTIENNGTVTIGLESGAKVDGKIVNAAEATVTINGIIEANSSTAAIENSGVVSINATVKTGLVIDNADVDATVQVVSLTGTVISVIDSSFDDEDAVDNSADTNKIWLLGTADKYYLGGITIKSVTYETVVSDDGVEKEVTYKALELSGTATATYYDEEPISNGDKHVGDVKLTTDGKILVNDSFTTCTGMTLKFGNGATYSEFIVNGTMTIVDKNQSNFACKSGELTVLGTVTSAFKLESIKNDTLDINAATYSVTDTAGTTYYYTTLANAIASGVKAVTVYGDVSVDADLTIPSGTTVTQESSSVITVAEEATLTIADGGKITQKAGTAGEPTQVYVEGTLYVTVEKTGFRNQTAVSDVKSSNGTDATYTNLNNAMADAESGDVIKLHAANVTVDYAFTIKEGVTLDTNTKNFKVSGAVLTINGTLYINGGSYSVEDKKSTNSDYVYESGVVLNGYIKNANQMNYNATVTDEISAETVLQNEYPAGAYYVMSENGVTYNYISTVANAAAVINDTQGNTFTIYGEVAIGDVAITGTSTEPAIVVIDAQADVTAGTVTLDLAQLKINDGGEFDGTVANSEGSVDVTLVDDTENSKPAAGTLVFDATTGTDGAKKLTVTGVGSNAALVFDGNVTAGAVQMGTMTVDGTLEIVGETIVTTKATVNGTVNVTSKGVLTGTAATAYIAGTLNVAAATASSGAGSATFMTMYVGLAIEEKVGIVDTTAGTVAGPVSVTGVTYVSDDSTVPTDITEKVGIKSIEFYVDDILWLTAYGTTTADVGNAPVVDADFIGWMPADAEDAVYTKDSTPNNYNKIPFGKEDKLYADVNVYVYDVTVSIDGGISTVAIDGNILVQGYNGYKLPAGINGGKLAAGEHTITYTLKNGYQGEATLSSSTASVDGLNFTLSGADRNIVLNLSGTEPATSTSGGSTSGGDDGLGLTDYLLIILVVLIVIMAIMVAMRLMRS